jgi:putative spermidine/putrescine transport system permease protein
MGKVVNRRRAAVLGATARWVFWGSLLAFFFFPLIAMARFAFQTVPVVNLSTETLGQGWTIRALVDVFTDPGTAQSMGLSLQLTLLTGLLALGAIIPVAVLAELFAPRLKPVIMAFTLLPWLVPPVALVVGVAATFREVAPWFLSWPLSLSFFYALWVLPFTYRAIDGQLRLIGAKTLYEAAQSVGSSTPVFIWKVILPSLKPALFVSSMLIIALVIGEFTFAALLLKETLPVYLLNFQNSNIRAGFALGLLVMLATAVALAVVARTLRKRGQSFSLVGVSR